MRPRVALGRLVRPLVRRARGHLRHRRKRVGGDALTVLEDSDRVTSVLAQPDALRVLEPRDP